MANKLSPEDDTNVQYLADLKRQDPATYEAIQKVAGENEAEEQASRGRRNERATAQASEADVQDSDNLQPQNPARWRPSLGAIREDEASEGSSSARSRAQAQEADYKNFDEVNLLGPATERVIQPEAKASKAARSEQSTVHASEQAPDEEATDKEGGWSAAAFRKYAIDTYNQFREDAPGFFKGAIQTGANISQQVGNLAQQVVQAAGQNAPEPEPVPAPSRPPMPEYARIASFRDITTNDVKAEIKSAGLDKAAGKTSAETEKLNIPGLFRGTKTVESDNTVIYERKALGGRYKRIQVYEEVDGKMEKTFEQKVNSRRIFTERVTEKDGEMIRSEEYREKNGYGHTFENTKYGRLMTAKTGSFYNMNVTSEHPEAEFKPDARKKSTAVLGVFKGNYDVTIDDETKKNVITQTGRSNPIHSKNTTQISETKTQTKITDYAGLVGRTYEKNSAGDDPAKKFITQRNVAGIYKMNTNQAVAAGNDAAPEGKNATRTVNVGVVGVPLFKREVIIHNESDMKTITTSVLGIARKTMVALSDEEKATRKAQLDATKPKVEAAPAAPKSRFEQASDALQHGVRAVGDKVNAIGIEVRTVGKVISENPAPAILAAGTFGVAMVAPSPASAFAAAAAGRNLNGVLQKERSNRDLETNKSVSKEGVAKDASQEPVTKSSGTWMSSFWKPTTVAANTNDVPSKIGRSESVGSDISSISDDEPRGTKAKQSAPIAVGSRDNRLTREADIRSVPPARADKTLPVSPGEEQTVPKVITISRLNVPAKDAESAGANRQAENKPVAVELTNIQKVRQFFLRPEEYAARVEADLTQKSRLTSHTSSSREANSDFMPVNGPLIDSNPANWFDDNSDTMDKSKLDTREGERSRSANGRG